MADRLPVAMLRVAFPLDGDGLAAPAPYDDGSGSLLSIDFAPGSPARDGIESGDLGNYAPSMWTADHSARGLRGGKSTVRERFLRLWNFFPAAARVRMDVQRWNAKGACDADLHDLAKLFLCDLDERSVEVVGGGAHDGWYKNDVLVLDDGWASVGPEGIMQYPLGPERHNAGPHVKREQVHVGAADDLLPEPAVGVRVMAPWKNRHMYPGRVGAVSKSKDKVKINFDDGDELVVPWAACRLRDAPRTSTYSFKRPQSLSESLSYAGLSDSQLKPRAQPAHESALKWVGFAATLAAISGIMHFAGTLTLFDIALNTWDRAAVIYPLCAISSVIWNMIHYDRKDSAAIAKAMGGFESNDDALRGMVGAVHARSGLGGDAPRVYIIPSDEPNAFAAGTKASVVAVTTGLLDLLTPRELRAVLAHEIGHVRNRDMARSLGAGCMVAGLGFAMTIGDMLMQGERRDRRRKSKDDKKDDGGLGSLGLILYASGAITQAMGTILRMMHSRSAEYAADAFAKSIGAGAGLASDAFAASYIDNPPERDSWLLTMGGWLRTHPR